MPTSLTFRSGEIVNVIIGVVGDRYDAILQDAPAPTIEDGAITELQRIKDEVVEFAVLTDILFSGGVPSEKHLTATTHDDLSRGLRFIEGCLDSERHPGFSGARARDELSDAELSLLSIVCKRTIKTLTSYPEPPGMPWYVQLRSQADLRRELTELRDILRLLPDLTSAHNSWSSGQAILSRVQIFLEDLTDTALRTWATAQNIPIDGNIWATWQRANRELQVQSPGARLGDRLHAMIRSGIIADPDAVAGDLMERMSALMEPLRPAPSRN